MRIHLDEIPTTGLTLMMEDRAEVVCETFGALSKEGFAILDPLEVHLQFKKLGDKVIMTGRLGTRVRLQCSRCLTDVNQAVTTDFRVVYMTKYPERLVGPARGEVVLTAEDVGLMLFENDVIDPGQALYEETLAAIPQKPLCSNTCKGLCTACGQNLNDGQCPCDNPPDDPRWAVLKKLKL